MAGIRGGGIAAGIAVLAVLYVSQQVRDIAAMAGWKIPKLPIPYGGSTLDNLLAVLIVAVGAVLLMLPRRLSFARDLGFHVTGWRAPLLAAVATVPVWIGFAMMGKLAIGWSWLDLAMLALAFPLAEEIVFRGFGFAFVRRGLGWSLALALVVQAVAFGAVHWLGAGGGGGVALQIFAITAAGALLFAAADAADGYSIWCGWVLHASMNAAFTVFTVSDSAAMGWELTLLRLGSCVLAILLIRTLARSRARRR